jgi:exosortase
MSTQTIEQKPERGIADLVILSLLTITFLMLYRGVMAKLFNDWSVDDNYSHGFLIVPLAIYFAWERRHTLAGRPHTSNPLGLVIVLVSLGMLVLGVLGAENFATEVSMIGALAGSVLFLQGWARFKAVLFPIAFLVLMIPIPAILFNQIALPLQFVASAFAESALGLFHIPVLREGNVIHLANISLEVEEACSGIRSLMSLLTLGVVYGYFLEPRTSMRLGLAITTIPVAILANGFRVAGTGIAAYYVGAIAAEGFLHMFSGWFVFLAAFVMLVLVHRSFVWIVSAFTTNRVAALPPVAANGLLAGDE